MEKNIDSVFENTGLMEKSIDSVFLNTDLMEKTLIQCLKTVKKLR